MRGPVLLSPSPPLSPGIAPASPRRLGRALAACAPLLAAACGGSPPSEPELRPVRFETVFSVDAGRVRSFSGTSQAADEPRLSFKVPGTVVRLPVTMGDAVKPGDVIAELDPQDFRLQADEAAATLGRAEAEARNAQANFERVRGLYENTNASRTDFDAARAAAESTRAAVESARKRLELARQQLSYTVLTAPVAGSVAETLVEVNENVHAGQEVVRLAVRSDLKVLVAVPESLIAQVKRGAEVTVRFDALPDRALKAVVTEVGVVATATGTAFPVRARLLETDPALRPGMAAAVELRFAAPGEGTRFRVPPNAVAEDRAGRYVLVVEPSGADRGVVRRRAVKVGDLTPGGLEILEGLRDGDRLVTAGVSRLTDGDPVKLPSEG